MSMTCCISILWPFKQTSCSGYLITSSHGPLAGLMPPGMSKAKRVTYGDSHALVLLGHCHHAPEMPCPSISGSEQEHEAKEAAQLQHQHTIPLISRTLPFARTNCNEAVRHTPTH